MDNIAHTLVGAALGRAVADRHVPLASVIGALAANAPDWTEFLIGLPGGPGQYLVLHRGVTHSLAGALVQVLALTLLVGGSWRLATRPPWRWIVACIGVAVLSHLFMDWQGSYGWRPFLPWNGRWYYLDWVAIVDPFFWLLPLIALAWGAPRHWLPLSVALLAGGGITVIILFFVANDAGLVAPWVLIGYGLLCVVAIVGWIRYWFGPVLRQRSAALAVLTLALYAGAQGIVADRREDEIRELAERRFGPTAQWAALTEVGKPFTWEAIYASPDTVAGDGWQLPRHLRSASVARALTETSEGRAMAQFARFLAAEVDPTEQMIYLRDARYARERGGWAEVRVRID